jgi:GTP-binding protein EngB required for normal cell division
MEASLEKDESLWLQMLESILTKKIDQSGNVVLLGNPKTGKKKIVTLMQEMVDQEILENETKEFKELEKVYIMDFKYIKIKKEDDENDFQDHGKINFHIINRKYKFMNEFWNREMLKNMLVIIVLDLKDPENLEKDFNEWLGFIQDSLKTLLNEVDFVVRNKMLADFKKTRDLLMSLNPDESKKGEGEAVPRKSESGTNQGEYQLTEIREEEEEEGVQDEGGRNGNDQDKNNEEQVIEGVDNYKLPILILANKSDYLDRINDEKLLKYIEYTLRKLAVENDAFLMSCSSHEDRNIDSLLDLLFYALLEKKEEVDSKKLEKSLVLNQLFLPLRTDTRETLDSLPVRHFDFPKQTKTDEIIEDHIIENQMSMIQDFFKDINTGVMKYSVNENVGFSSRNINLNYSNLNISKQQNNSSNNTRTTPINTLRIQNILNRKND